MKGKIISGGEAVKQIVLGTIAVYGFIMACALLRFFE